MCLTPQRRAIFRQFLDIRTSKSGPRPAVFNILTCKCASRYSGAQFFDIETAKTGPGLMCFVHFDFEMYFALQRRAIFAHPNFKKWPENGCVLYILIGNVHLATAACNS